MNYKVVDLRDASDELQESTINMKLRPMDILECRMAGTSDTKKAIALGMHLSENHHCYIGVNTITDEPEFIWGVAASEDPTVGIPWLLGTSDFKISTDWLKRCKREFAPVVNNLFPILRNFIHRENKQSIVWLKWLGFQFYETKVSFTPDGMPANVLLFAKLGDNSVCAIQH